MALKIDTQLSTPLAEAATEVRGLADAGVDGVFTFEGPNDVFFPLVLAADAAAIDLYTNLAIAFPRSPTHLAHQAYDLQRLSGGRFALGLGTQIRPHIEGRYGARWTQPVDRMREMVEAVRAVFRCWHEGERLDFQGDHYRLTLMPPLFNPGPVIGGPPPIWVGAVGPRMTRMVAETADGLLIHPFTTDRFVRQHTLPILEQSHAATGRVSEAFTVICETIVCAYRDDAERVTAEAGVRGLIGFYGSTPAYRPVLEAHGWEHLQPELNELSKAGRWEEMAGLIDDDVLNTVAVCGEPDAVGGQIAARFGDVADRLAFYLPYEAGPGLTAEIIHAVRSAPVPQTEVRP